MSAIEKLDVVVVGAGISGICAAHYIKERVPGCKFAVLERRAQLGGTWDLFKYPGVRSDSDMFTFGYSFKPWPSPKFIAPGADILDYLSDTVRTSKLGSYLRFNQHVVKADWNTIDARWRLQCANGDTYECKFLFACSGYYQQDAWHAPEFKDSDKFQGTIVHPQKWDEKLSTTDKQVVVIGSGATAITLLPSIAQDAAHVTMLQRSPSYVIAWPNRDVHFDFLSQYLPTNVVHPLIRWKRILQHALMTWWIGRQSDSDLKKFFIDLMRQALPEKFMKDEEFTKHFTPNYNPWEQRLCLSPDGDFFRCLAKRKASVVTDHIERFDEKGIVLQSGERIDCDVIVTATGLKMQHNMPMATMQVSIDGQPYVPTEHCVYKAAMISDVPNFAFSMGYFTASWTLRAELTCAYVCRILNHLRTNKLAYCAPRFGEDDEIDEDDPPMSSGYIRRSYHLQPKFGKAAPWARTDSYMSDWWNLSWMPLDDGKLEFCKPMRSAL